MPQQADITVRLRDPLCSMSKESCLKLQAEAASHIDALRAEKKTIFVDTLTNLAEALKKVAPEVVPQIIAAHAEYHRRLALQEEAFQDLLKVLRAPA